MNKGTQINVGFLVAFAFLVASLVYNATSIDERVQQAGQPVLQEDLPRVSRWIWPSLRPPPSPGLVRKGRPSRDLFEPKSR